MRTRLSLSCATLVALLIMALPGAQALTLDPTWTKTAGGAGFDLGQAVALDPEGNVIITGTSSANGNEDMLTIKFSRAGDKLWERRYHESQADRSEGVVTDSAGNVFVAGSVTTLAGDDAILRKFSPDGSPQWLKRFDKGTSESARSLAIDSSGNLYMAGVSMSINGGDGFVTKFDRDGAETWSTPINHYFLDEIFDVSVDGSGNAIAAGRVARDNSFDAIITKLVTTGNVLWTQFLGETGAREEARGVAATKDGNVFIAGTTTEKGGADLLVARYAADGTLAWKKIIDLAQGDDEGRDVVIDTSGNLLVTGFAVTDGTKNAFVLRLDADGNELWRHVAAMPGIAGNGGIAVSADGSLVAVAGARQGQGDDFDFLAILYDQGTATSKFAHANAPSSSAPVTFSDASTGKGGVTTWTWDFGDGGTSTQQNPSHAYQYGGQYTVGLTVRDAYGNVAHSTKDLSVSGAGKPDTTTAPPTPEESRGPTPSTNPPTSTTTDGGNGGGGGLGRTGLIALIGIAAIGAATGGYFFLRRRGE